MTQDSLSQRIETRLAAEGYVSVLRQPLERGLEKPAQESSYFLLKEYWRLDNPRVRAYMQMDLSRGNQFVVTFHHQPARPFPLRLLDRFIAAAAPHSITLQGEDVCTRYNALPFAAEPGSAKAQRELAKALAAEIRPFFFIDPETSNAKTTVLRAHAESDLAQIIAAEERRNRAHPSSSLKRRGWIAAKQLLGTTVLNLHVPVSGGDQIGIDARQMVSMAQKASPRLISLERFLDNHAEILESTVRQCRNQQAAPFKRQP